MIYYLHKYPHLAWRVYLNNMLKSATFFWKERQSHAIIWKGRQSHAIQCKLNRQ